MDRCSYTHRITEPGDQRGVIESDWHCPHAIYDNSDKCVFHLPPEELDLTDEEVAQRFCWVVNGDIRRDEDISEADRRRYLDTDLSPRERTQFIGAKFGDFHPPVRELVVLEAFRATGEPTPIDLRECSIDGVLDMTHMGIHHGIRLNGSSIGEFDGRKATVEGNMEFTGATIHAGAQLDEAHIGGRLELDAAYNRRESEFEPAVISEGLTASEAIVGDDTILNAVTVSGYLDFKRAEIEGALELRSRVSASVDAENDIGVISEAPAIEGNAKFTEATIEEGLTLQEATVGGTTRADEATVKGNAVVSSTTLEDGVTLSEARFESGLTLTGTSIGGVTDFTDSTFEHLELAPALTHSAWQVVDLTESDITEGRLGQPEDGRVFYDVTEATIGEVTVQASDDTPYRFVRFRNTEFDGFDFAGEAEKLGAVDWKLYTLSEAGYRAFADVAEFDDANQTVFKIADHFDPRLPPSLPTTNPESIRLLPEENEYFPDDVPMTDDVVGAIETLSAEIAALDPAELSTDPAGNITTTSVVRRVSTEPLVKALVRANRTVDVHRPSAREKAATQRRAKNAAREAGMENLAAHFFIDEMRAYRSMHAQKALDPDPDDTLVERLQAGYDWLGNGLLDLTTVYGERTNRVFVVALGTVGVFAVLFRLLSSPTPTGQGWGDYLLFSFQSFVAFILGSTPNVSNFYIQFVSAVEGFLGAFFTALIVFSLTRSVHR